jgi:hypothetical protein
MKRKYNLGDVVNFSSNLFDGLSQTTKIRLKFASTHHQVICWERPEKE